MQLKYVKWNLHPLLITNNAPDKAIQADGKPLFDFAQGWPCMNFIGL